MQPRRGRHPVAGSPRRADSMEVRLRRALIVVPSIDLSITQYRRMRKILEEQGFQVQVASSRRVEISQGKFCLLPDLELSQASGADYDLVVFVAGRGNKDLWHDPAAHRVVREALAAHRVVGASGAAVPILAYAGVLQGRHATGPLSLATLLGAKGAKYTPGPVAVDDGIVTLRKSEFYVSFARQILEQVSTASEPVHGAPRAGQARAAPQSR
jgi:putative intracellular protease/amidase